MPELEEELQRLEDAASRAGLGGGVADIAETWPPMRGKREL